MLPVPSEALQRMSLAVALHRYFSIYYKKMSQRRANASGRQVAVEVRQSHYLVPKLRCSERPNVSRMGVMVLLDNLVA